MAFAPSRKIVGRRSRPAKAALSRDVIVAAALEILSKEGITHLSLRRVATALDTGASSLYVYLTSLDELHALMLDQALKAVALSAADSGPWRERLKSYLLSYVHTLNAGPGLAQLAMSTVATGPNSLRLWEVMLGMLEEGGVADHRLVEAADMLLLHVTAASVEEADQRRGNQNFDRVTRALADVSAEQFPLIASLVSQGRFAGDDGDDDARLRRALDVILDGLVAEGNQSTKSTREQKL